MYRLLIVEDEEIIRWGLREQIPWESYGFQVVGEAENGKAALELIPQLYPDVVLVDIMMPVMNGIELIARLKEEYSHIKVIVLSGYSEFEYARQCIEYGAYAYLLKPTKDNAIKKIFLKVKDELDQVFDSNKELETIKKKVEIGLPFMKNRFISDILKGQYSEEDADYVSRQMDRLGISAEKGFMVIMLQIDKGQWPAFVRESFDGKNEFVSLIEGVIKSFLEIEILEIKVMNSYEVAVILCSRNMISKRYGVLAASKIKEGLEYFIQTKYFNCTAISVGVGNFYKNILKLKDSYIKACIALKSKFFKGKGLVIHVDDCINLKVEGKQSFNYFSEEDNQLRNKIIESTIFCNAGSLTRAIEQYFDKMRDFGVGDEENIFIGTVEILILLSMRLSEDNINFSNIYDKNIHVEIRWIMERETLRDLKEWVISICLNVIKFIDNMVKESKIDPLIEKVKKYININYDKKITLNEICDLTYISPSYFCSLFKLKTDSTFTGYLMRVRIEKAKELLKNPGLKVYEVAMMVGYDDFRHFTKVFKKFEGISPLQYREARFMEGKEVVRQEGNSDTKIRLKYI